MLILLLQDSSTLCVMDHLWFLLSFTEHSLIQCHQQFANMHHILKDMFYHKVSTYSKHVWCQKYTLKWKYDLRISNYRATSKSNCFFGWAGNFVVCTEFHQKWKWNVGKPHFPRTYTPGRNMTNLPMKFLYVFLSCSL